MIDLLYVVWNRLEFTKASFNTLIAQTEWSEVRCLFINDDGSTDGTREWLIENVVRVPVPVQFASGGDDLYGRGPVAAMSRYLDWHADHPRVSNDPDSEPVEVFAKIDNDFIVCPGWLPEMQRVMTYNPGLDVLGTEPMFGPPQFPPCEERSRTMPIVHVGGKGLIRHRVFSQCRPQGGGWNGYQGWTQYQTAHVQLEKAWITPDLPTFGLDQIDLEPWKSLTDQYVANGWQRRWPLYADGGDSYFAWWA